MQVQKLPYKFVAILEDFIQRRYSRTKLLMLQFLVVLIKAEEKLNFEQNQLVSAGEVGKVLLQNSKLGTP